MMCELYLNNDTLKMKSNTYYNMNKPPDIMLCQRSQTQKTTNCKIPFKWNVQNRQNL